MTTDEEIRELAYAIWEEDGWPTGQDVRHYLVAKDLLEMPEGETVVPSRRMLVVNEEVCGRLDECRGRISRAELLEFCLEQYLRANQPRTIVRHEAYNATRAFSAGVRGYSPYISKPELWDLERSIRELLTNYMRLVLLYCFQPAVSESPEMLYSPHATSAT